MIEKIIKAIFGDIDTKKIKKFTRELKHVRELEAKFQDMTLEDIEKRNLEIKASFSHLDFQNPEDSKALSQGLESVKHEAAALWILTCKLLFGKTFTTESGKEVTWNMLPYDVQVIGGLAIHEGNVAEMKTGEGKTLVATFPAYLNALSGNAVHIVTVNDYLASRDAEEMGILYTALGLKVGVITHNQSRDQKKLNYASDIIYATNNELGFDYLRDNMASEMGNKVMNPRFYAIIDEVDSILIDEARTPLIISQPDNEPTEKYLRFSALAKKLEKGVDYKIDEKQKASTLTEAGIKKVETMLGVENIYVSDRYNDIHHIENALRASSVYLKDKDYIIRNEEVMIVDEHTGRVLPGRRYSDGLHQALEAKEGVKIQQESKTLASITFQNYFRTYWKLAGMTGTAKTEEEEFYKVYGLETLAIPTNKPIAREDKADLLFKNEKGKFEYVVNYIQELHKTGQPILVGTVSVDKSEYLSAELHKVGVPHKVLNAKQHESEAETVAAAGQRGAVTIATNMAGRGTDIKLGEGVIALGGLIILGTEKHETRRIDNQLRGRAGRQGDPGVTQFLISPNDDIMRIFGGDKLFGIFNSAMFASLPDDQPLAQSGMLTKKVTGVQKQVEGHHFDARKHVLEYDDVINKHREIIYKRRDAVLSHVEASPEIEKTISEMVYNRVKNLVLAEEAKQGEAVNKNKLVKRVHEYLGRPIIDDFLEKQDITAITGDLTLADYIAHRAVAELEMIRSEAPDNDAYYSLLKKIMLQSIDRLWMNHIDGMSKLREQVAFVGYAQKQPIMVYKEEAFKKFKGLVDEIELRIVKSVFAITPATEVQIARVDDSTLQVSSSEIENMGVGQSDSPKNSGNTSQGNPIFAQNRNQTTPRKKIRV
ncbi:preprotein translocase subunit SecA [Candidatus Gracilibacteria bacterium]|nr:preprotein translocase subunit SecA [Candidatus Gracilibacteria bacterium]